MSYSGFCGGENHKTMAMYQRFHHTGGVSVSAHIVFQQA